MADQNRKTTEQKLWRRKAEQTVEQYLDYLFCDADGQSIAREGRTLLGIYSEHGSIPRGSGFSGFCTLAARVDRMRIRHATDWMLAARDAVVQLESQYIDALCIDRFYRNKTKVATDPFTEKRVEIYYGDQECAWFLRISKDTLRKRISRGYQMLEEVLQSNKQAA
ncbi:MULTISPECIES: hypothetical protein [unclassified Marinobacter]|uniref:hypothetical protein n=1 Tax=unclassified Marinobacter TaxID=83889 RepID=UPI0019286328|nr:MULTISPECIES: hypothetical protein [unclassified Marinobacter]MBL3825150.1 hypothetical protein [Marinobacter sp. MC3]MBL3893646.1 hypothetical protein [Marinobacter sp. MW3]